jgi:Rps23 Pro-64 3,4-dihydroxylase Tpa1-like proline 4-hydroxylase
METNQPNTSLSQLGSLLPLPRMASCASESQAAYLSARPFPHVVLDEFFDRRIVEELLAEFPRPRDIQWQKFDNEREVKLASAAEASFGSLTRLFLYHLNSITFLEFLTSVTGIPDLIPDPSFEGGGLHQIPRGGKLGIHADFNKHRRYGLDRRLNAILYLNKDWKDEYGGHLELWDTSMSGCQVRIAPVFNRLVIFSTTDFTYHGHPDPLQCPDHLTRKSLALYYFTNGRPSSEVTGSHSTLFKARSSDDYRPSFTRRAKGLIRDILPPILTRQLEKLR